MEIRKLSRVIPALPASDGAGVKLRRSLGSSQALRLDPFLMLDEFYSDDPEDYLAGFPAHPHRGFETVTYMLDGHMRHEDNFGHRGDLGPGDVQWMSAAGGIIHSEMPQQTEGRMRGFQLWLNLPAADKMKPAAYRDIPAREIPELALPNGVRAKLIAGTLTLEGRQAIGAVDRLLPPRATAPLYLDLRLPPKTELLLPVPATHNAFVYAYEGAVAVGDPPQDLPLRAAGLLSEGSAVSLRAGPQEARVLLLAGRPLREPVVQYGPFVMNSSAEIEQALADYQAGRLHGIPHGNRAR